jgi:hypothetical protein
LDFSIYVLYKNGTLIESTAERNNDLQLTHGIVKPELQIFSVPYYWINYVLSNEIEVKYVYSPNPVTEMSMTWVCGCSLAGTAGSNTGGGVYICLL